MGGDYTAPAPPRAESGVKRNIPGPCGKALAVSGNPGWGDGGRDASGAGGTGRKSGPNFLPTMVRARARRICWRIRWGRTGAGNFARIVAPIRTKIGLRPY